MKGIQKEIFKTYENAVKEHIKAIIKPYGYKGKSGYLIYKVIDEYFISGNYGLNCNDNVFKFHISLGIKKLSYDELLWEIMKMETNKEEPISLRAEGAFVAPSFPICKFEYVINQCCDIPYILNIMMADTEKSLDVFFESQTLSNIIIKKNLNVWQYDCLKTLAYIDCSDYENAIIFLEEELAKGRKGPFMQGNDCFNNLAIDYCKAKLKL